ncbi:MAG: DUF4271 domain-containing protein, partial [Alistipes sp.]|nr:DUF4271 domain-containing protein [Alistipes sp.]
MATIIDSLHSSGLDTLSEYRLRRMTEEWTGELYPAKAADSLSVDGVVSDATLAEMAERWRMARSVYRNADAESVMGSSSRLAADVSPMADAAPINDAASMADVASMADAASMADVASMTDAAEVMAADTLSVDAVAEALAQADGASQVFWLQPELLLNGVVAVIVLAYIYCIYRYFDDVMALIQSAFNHNVIVSDRVNERRRSDIFYGFLGKLSLLGIGFVGVFATIWAVRNGRDMLGLSADEVSFSPLIGMGLFLAVVVAQYLMLIIVGGVTRSMSTTMHLLRMRLTYFVFATVAAAPLLLISQVAVGYNIWFVVACVTALLVLILYLRESLELFISKK